MKLGHPLGNPYNDPSLKPARKTDMPETNHGNHHTPGAIRFGTFKGVFLPSLLTVLGVVMYLRIGWMVGHAGLAGALVIITLASSITFLTGLSISATATNMRIGGGGAYYMISRSFGFEAGAAVGLPLYLAQTLGISFYLAGFSESLKLFFPGLDPVLPSVGGLIVLGILSYISADLALRAQLLIFVLIASSLVSFALGHPSPAAVPAIPSMPHLPFWAVFAVFFPAVTGIEAGLAMSGELKNPSRSLPWGTIGAVLTGWAIYLGLAVMISGRASADDLIANSLVMAQTSVFLPAFVAGLWGASLSSALGSLLGAPRTLQALAQDGVVPRFLARTDGPNATPRLATSVTILIAAWGITMGGLNVIGPVLSMFFLTSYGLLNLSAGLEGLIGNPSWRPQFKSPWYLSLAGAAACLGAMFMIDAGATFIALFLVTAVYLLMMRQNIQPRWSDFRRSIVIFLARQSIYTLHRFGKNPRSWRPHLLVLSGSPTTRWHLVELADWITHGQGFLTVAAIVSRKDLGPDRLENMEQTVQRFLTSKNVPALVEISTAEDFFSGVRSLVATYGIGPLTANTIVLGFNEKEEDIEDFAGVLLDIHRRDKNIMLIREGTRPPRPDTRKRNVDIWWGSRSASDGFMLAMAYMIQTSDEWRKSRLRLNTLYRDPEEQEHETKRLREFVLNGRIQAGYRVLPGEEEVHPLHTIAKYTDDSDLLILGLRPPEEGETPAQYAVYYRNVLRLSKEYPRSVFCLAGEELDFKAIFT